jgi:hypothetical protein
LYELRRRSAIKGKARGEGDHLTPKIIHRICVCVLASINFSAIRLIKLQIHILVMIEVGLASPSFALNGQWP